MALVEVVYYRLKCKSPYHDHCIGWEKCGDDFDDDGWGDCNNQGGCMPVPNVDARELERIKNEAVKDAVSAMTGVLIACQISAMKKHYGWGKRVRLPRVAEQVFDEWKYFNQSGMTPKEYIDSIGRITGINVDVSLR